jgi:hypothetical protein
MKEVKPTRHKKQRLELPKQQTVDDTSNWENRRVTAATLDKTKTKRIVREIEFIKPEKLQGLTTSQIRKELATQEFTDQQIEKRLSAKKTINKSSH